MLLFGHIGITLGVAWLINRIFRIKMDYRLVAIGSLLPDMLDKPLGMIILPLNNGRIFGHTLLFVLILLLIGLRCRKSMFLSFASFCHLIEDKMWNEPETFFWPLLGSEFPTKEHTSLHEYLTRIMSEYMPSVSYIFISEVIGLIIILIFIFTNCRNKL